MRSGDVDYNGRILTNYAAGILPRRPAAPMIIVLSPAKSLDYRSPPTLPEHTQPAFLEHSQILVDKLRLFSPAALASLLKILHADDVTATHHATAD